MTTVQAPARVKSGEPLRVTIDGQTYRRHVQWMATRCYDRGVCGGLFTVSTPRRECPHGCLDLPGYPCMTCQGTGYVVRYAQTCTARFIP